MDRSLMGRVEALERGMRFHRRLSGGLAALVALFVLSAFQEDDGPPEVYPAVIQAQSFEVVDREGEVQLRAGSKSAGGFLEVLNDAGRSCVRLEVNDAGGFASVSPPTGEPTVVLTTNRYGGALRVMTHEGKRTFVVGVERNTSFLNMFAKDTAFFRATSDLLGNGVVQVFDKKGMLRGDLAQRDEVVPQVIQARRIEVIDEHGRALFRVSENEKGGQLEVMNKQGSTIFRTFAAESGGQMTVLDPLGEDIFSASVNREGGQIALYNHGGRASFLASVTRLAAEVNIFGNAKTPIVSFGNDYKGDGRVRVTELRGGSQEEMKID